MSLTEAEKSWLRDHPVVRLGVGTSFAPIQYVVEEKGEYFFQGIASDYVEILSELLGVEFVIRYGITFQEALEMGKNKEIDLFPCVAYSEERDTFLEFTDGYLENPIVIFANEDAPFINSIHDLAGLKVADVEALYIYNQLKQDIPGIDFVLAPNAEACLESVAFGKADANAGGLIFGSYMIRKNNWTNIKVAAPTPYPNTVFRMAVRKDWPELAGIIDKALHSIDREKKNEIHRKWISVRYEYGIDRKTVMKRMLFIGAGSIVVICLILLWVLKLRKEIRQRKEAEKSLYAREMQLREMVKEKELLIREVYHRVKNNLAIIGSLVRLQATELSDPKDIDKMDMVQERIQSIILLHEKLSLSQNLKEINFPEYLTELILGIRRSQNGNISSIDIVHDTVQVSFDGKIIVPLGLITTELVTNALKYGFTGKSNGRIEITLHRAEERNGGYILRVKNNGTTLPEDFILNKQKSLGLSLVSNLVDQLKGKMELSRLPFTEFTISFDV